MRIVVVGGSAAKVGKTTLACRLLTDAAETYKMALKVSVHDDCESAQLRILTPDDIGTDKGDSKRLLQAGALAVVLVTSTRARIRSGLAEGLHVARRMRPELLVIESTAAGIHLHYVSESWFVSGETPWKPWAREHLTRATHLRRTQDVIAGAPLGAVTA